jgi:hypothetical protein
MSSYACITDLVEHIVVETKHLMKGTKHEGDWMFYHDALTLMTAKETIVGMKEKGYLDWWILPANGLHTDDAALTYYFCKSRDDAVGHVSQPRCEMCHRPSCNEHS